MGNCGSNLPDGGEIVSKVYMDVSHGGQPIGQIRIGLYDKDLPKTCENFRKLCTGEVGYGYAGSVFHRLEHHQFLQGGDFEQGTGKGGKSIWGGTFEDEGFPFSHNRRGGMQLSMANKGKDKNSSHFFITLDRMNRLNGKHVVFGEILDQESISVVQYMGSVPTPAMHGEAVDMMDPKRCVPVQPLKIERSGLMQVSNA